MSRLQASKRLQQLTPTSPRKDGFDFADNVDGPSWTELESFSQGLFNDKEVVKIRDAAIATKFIQGMVLGTLNPKQYGGFMVQDAAYCFAAVEAVDNAAREMQHQGMLEFSSLYQEQSKLLKEYNEDFVKTWHLKNAESIVMGPAADKYVKYEDDVSRQRPKFLAIAMLPCIMLWPWIANQLISHVEKKSTYYFWFEENKIEEGDLKKFVDSHFSPEEKEEALVIFREGMINELNFSFEMHVTKVWFTVPLIFHYVNQICLLVFFYELKDFVAQ